MVWRGTELGLHLLHALDHEVHARFEDVVQLQTRVHQLHEVLVPGDDPDLVSGLAGARRQGADDVVGLVAGDLEQLDAVRRDDPADVLQLLDHLLGGPLTGRLVFGVALVSERRSLGVQRDGHQVGSFLAEDPAQRHGEAVGCARGAPVGRGEARAHHREVRPIGDGGAVEEEESTHDREATGRGSALLAPSPGNRKPHRGTRAAGRRRVGKPVWVRRVDKAVWARGDGDSRGEPCPAVPQLAMGEAGLGESRSAR